ncbi:branched-chain amino acid transaminase [candidate division WS5 bacterium]|uniref:Branched-chain-amino-acid aminotransferase n=1 Tax=candidate division WS5 bacterium TaxID=2093353 RepID=A0A419DAG7_9BACT|nr:MAG: branched-chain amino acid transaminase [candidate division WS5 bacterium]
MQKLADYIWMDGEFVPFEESKIHILNHSLHYGSGVFEGIRCYDTSRGPAVFRLDDHVKRLFKSAKVMKMDSRLRGNDGWGEKETIEAILETIKKNNLKECYIRPLIFYGGKMGLDPADADISVMIAVWPWGKYLAKDAVSVEISDFTRIHPKSSVMEAKISGHYTNSILASTHAKRNGFDEALLLDYKGNIAEGPGENIFFVKGQALTTPKKGSILPGITRDTIIQISKSLGFETIEKDIKPEEIKDFDEAFFVGTAVEVNAIGQINNTKYADGGEGRATKQIKGLYLDIVHGKKDKYEKWLSHVK